MRARVYGLRPSAPIRSLVPANRRSWFDLLPILRLAGRPVPSYILCLALWSVTLGYTALRTVLALLFGWSASRRGAPFGPIAAQATSDLASVGVLAACVAGHVLAPGTPYKGVFLIVGLTAWGGYALALWQSPIWKGTKVSTTIKMTFDGLLYALLTAGTFGWLWPK